MEKVLIVGSGIIGLSTAALIREKTDFEVVLVSAKKPSETVSIVAGGLWEPFHVEPENLANSWARDTLKFLVKELKQGKGTVESMPALRYTTAAEIEEEGLPSWRTVDRDVIDFEVLDTKDWAKAANVNLSDTIQQYEKVFKSTTLIMNTPLMLQELEEKLQNDPKVKLTLGSVYFDSLNAVTSYAKENGIEYVINCTGLGALDLYPTEKGNLKPARGVVLVYDRPSNDPLANMCHQARGSYIATETHPAYFIPRGEIIVVGGTWLRDDSRTTATEEEIENIKRNAACFCPSLQNVEPKEIKVGFRPHRENGIRFDVINTDDVVVINNYGHGGGGWTLHYGAALANLKELQTQIKKQGSKCSIM